jgi:Polyketide cyclase / dehydrase and lipid transport
MASIRTEAVINASPDAVWDALRDWGQLHTRLAPGFVVDVQLDDVDRIVTFGSGTVLRERLVALDEEARRLVWSVVDGPYSHHNGAAQVFDDGDGRARFVWTADLLPDAAEATTRAAMLHGTEVIKATLDAAAP